MAKPEDMTDLEEIITAQRRRYAGQQPLKKPEDTPLMRDGPGMMRDPNAPEFRPGMTMLDLAPRPGMAGKPEIQDQQTD